MTTRTNNEFTAKKSNLFLNGNRVNPEAFKMINIPWNIFLTFHFRTSFYYGDNDHAVIRRERFIEELKTSVYKVNIKYGLKQNALLYIGVNEKKTERVHVHSLFYLRDDAVHLLDKIHMDFYKFADRKIIDMKILRSSDLNLPKNIQKVENSNKSISYILKTEFNSEFKDIFFSDRKKNEKKKAILKVASYFEKKKKQSNELIPLRLLY